MNSRIEWGRIIAMKFKECKFILKWLSLCLCRQGWVSSRSLRAVPLGLFWDKNTWSRCTSRHLLSLDYHCYMASHWFVVILSTCSVLMFVNTWLLTQLPIWQDATQGSRLLSIICLRYWDKKNTICLLISWVWSREGWQRPLILPLFGFPWSPQLRNLSIIRAL